MATGSEWPELSIGRDIHARLSTGDPVAPADLADSFLDPLATWLLRTNHTIDPHLCEQAAEDAILTLIKNPQSFQPNRSDLNSYLRMSARGDLRNLLDRERRHSSRRAALEVVELIEPDRNMLQETDPARIFERTEDANAANLVSLRDSIAARGTPGEGIVLTLMNQGERSTAAFALVLGLSHLPLDEQRREVKRVKDRLKRRIERARVSNDSAD